MGGKSFRSQSVLGEMGQGKACLPSVKTRPWPFWRSWPSECGAQEVELFPSQSPFWSQVCILQSEASMAINIILYSHKVVTLVVSSVRTDVIHQLLDWVSAKLAATGVWFRFRTGWKPKYLVLPNLMISSKCFCPSWSASLCLGWTKWSRQHKHCPSPSPVLKNSWTWVYPDLEQLCLLIHTALYCFHHCVLDVAMQSRVLVSSLLQ